MLASHTRTRTCTHSRQCPHKHTATSTSYSTLIDMRSYQEYRTARCVHQQVRSTFESVRTNTSVFITLEGYACVKKVSVCSLVRSRNHLCVYYLTKFPCGTSTWSIERATAGSAVFNRPKNAPAPAPAPAPAAPPFDEEVTGLTGAGVKVVCRRDGSGDEVTLELLLLLVKVAFKT